MAPSANSSDPLAKEVHGTNPQRIVEKILRTKIYNCTYWKERLFGLTAETLVDRAIELTHVGGTYGGLRKPTKFMCLLLKMLQIAPDYEIVLEFVKNDDHKYVRCLGALYLRCTGRPQQIYKFLEPLLADYSAIRCRAFDGWSLSHVDEFVDDLLAKDYCCDIALPHLPRRWHLEKQGLLQPRAPLVADEDDDEDQDQDRRGAAGKDKDNGDEQPPRKKTKKKKKKDHTTATKKDKAWTSLFKKTTEDDKDDAGGEQQDAAFVPSSLEDTTTSIEATNDLRRRLGLKPLR